MAELADLERRIRVLEDIEAIKKLKSKYFECLDRKKWDELLECLAEDAAAEYGHYDRIEGGKTIVEWVKGGLGRESAIHSHQGHMPNIDITSDTTAKGTWYLFDYGIDTDTNRTTRMAAFYYDEYVKEKGEWKIKFTGYKPVFIEEWQRTDISLTR